MELFCANREVKIQIIQEMIPTIQRISKFIAVTTSFIGVIRNCREQTKRVSYSQNLSLVKFRGYWEHNRHLQMKKLKKGIISFAKFLCMFMILGVQNLLHGSWTPHGPNQNAT